MRLAVALVVALLLVVLNDAWLVLWAGYRIVMQGRYTSPSVLWGMCFIEGLMIFLAVLLTVGGTR